MKRKVIIVVIILVLILVGMGIFISKSSKNNNEAQNLNNYSEFKEDLDLNGDFSKNESTYDSDFLEKLDDSEDLDGKIIDIKTFGTDLYTCTGNKVYRYGLLRI